MAADDLTLALLGLPSLDFSSALPLGRPTCLNDHLDSVDGAVNIVFIAWSMAWRMGPEKKSGGYKPCAKGKK